jgi:hypothetical protein
MSIMDIFSSICQYTFALPVDVLSGHHRWAANTYIENFTKPQIILQPPV